MLCAGQKKRITRSDTSTILPQKVNRTGFCGDLAWRFCDPLFSDLDARVTFRGRLADQFVCPRPLA